MCNNGLGNVSSSDLSPPQSPNELTISVVRLLQQLDLTFSHFLYLPLPLRQVSCLSAVDIHTIDASLVPCFTVFETFNCLCFINLIRPLGIPRVMPVSLTTRNIADHLN